MLRVVVPTFSCRDPLEEMFRADRAWYFQPQRAMGCRRMNSLMTWPMLAAFADALESSSSTQDNDDNACSCHKRCCKPDGASTDQADRKPKDQCSVVNPDETAKPSSNEQMSGSRNQSSEKVKTPEAVSVPMKRLDTGRFQVSLDLKTFQPEEIEVNRVGNELKINAKQQVQRHGMIFHREVQRSCQLPDDVDVETLKSTLTATGVLSVEAQRIPQHSESSHHPRKDDQENLTDVEEDQSEETFNESTMNADCDKTTEHRQDISTDDENTEKAKETTEEDGECNQNEGQTDLQEE